MKKIVCLLLTTGLLFGIYSCKEEMIDSEQQAIVLSVEKDGEHIKNALNWYNSSPEENAFPLLDNAQDLKWSQAIVHDVDTAIVVEIPIQLKKQDGLRVKDDAQKNVEQRLLVVNQNGGYYSLLEFIVSERSKKELEDPEKVNFSNVENNFEGTIICINNRGETVSVNRFSQDNNTRSEIIQKSARESCIALFQLWSDGTETFIGILYCYTDGIGNDDDAGGSGNSGYTGSVSGFPDTDDCPCTLCKECGKCEVDLLKSVPKPGGINGGDPNADCPVCDCPQTNEQIARSQIEYLKQRGARELAEVFENLLRDRTLPMRDVNVIYEAVEKAYLQLKADYMVAIFNSDNVATILSFYFTSDISKVARIKSFNLCRRKNISVLGHYPDYIKLADEFNANRFSIPTGTWNSLSEAERWALNIKFLDDVIANGDEIMLATKANEARVGSYYWKELQYLYSKGYKISPNQLRLYK